MKATPCAGAMLEARPHLHVVPMPRDDARDELVVDVAVAARWRALGALQRARIAAFLDGSHGRGTAHELRTDASLPADIARDLVRGAPTLRAAFPDLVRRVTGVDRTGDVIEVRVACAGEHRGPFFRILSPTKHVTVFDVVHRIVLDGDGPDDERVTEHHVAIDVRAIVLQLSRARRLREPAPDQE